MTDKAAERLLSGRAWDDFCETIRRAGHLVEQWGDTPDELDRAEWYRFCSRLVRNGLERFMENCEPDRPRLRDAAWRQSINFQSPDQDHLLAEFVDGSGEYRITGNRGSAPYFVMASWTAPLPADIGAHDWAERGVEALKEFDPATMRTTHFLQSDNIDFDAAGNFEVFVGQTPRERNWLQITPDCVGLLIRVVYHQRALETAPVMRIERLDQAAPRPVRPEEVSASLARAGQTVLGYAELVRSWWHNNLSHRPNQLQFSQATYLSNGGVPDRHHGFGTWEKTADDALVITFTPPECEYWIFQLCNIWQENLDNYEDGQGYLSKFGARYEEDGLVRIVIADRNPGIGGNWIDPFGHSHGGMSLRLIKTPTAPEVTLYRVNLAELEQRGWNLLDEVKPLVSGEIVP